MIDRPSWHEYFMKMALLVLERSTCSRRQVGAVLVKNNQIITSGYNGTPKGITHCAANGCLREQLNVPSGQKHELCRGVHAEQNAIIQAAVNGTPIVESVLYTTNFPCAICAKMIINAEIKVVYVLEDYPDSLAKELFAESDTEVILIDMEKKSLKKIV
jgi:dCMP deaminase